MGYLLKDRVTSLEALADALTTIPAGGTVLDPEVVAQLLVARRADPLAALPRASGGARPDGRRPQQRRDRRRLVVSPARWRSTSNIFTKIDLPDVGADNRRVLAVLAWLRSR